MNAFLVKDLMLSKQGCIFDERECCFLGHSGKACPFTCEAQFKYFHFEYSARGEKQNALKIEALISNV